MRGYFFTNARKIYYHMRVSIARFLNDLQVTRTFTVLRLRGSICHMRGYFFTNARKIYYHMRVSIARFLNDLQVTRTFTSQRAHNSNHGIWVELDRPSGSHDTRTGR